MDSYCGNVSNADPRAFGPVTWRALHLIAQNYPGGIGDENEQPNMPTITACEKFTSSLPYMLPAHGAHMASLLELYPHKCDNGTQLQEAMVSAHNTISAGVGGLDPWTNADAAGYYTTIFQCLTDPQWGTRELCRVVMPNQTCTTTACTGCIPYTGNFTPAGVCGPIFSANPRVFGPPTWKMLHIMAEYYPDAPTAQVVAACRNFTSSLPLMLPCDHCGYHLNETIQSYTAPICTSADDLQEFLVHAHNRVSKYVHPNRSIWTRDDASNLYRETHACLHSRELTFGVPLDRGHIGDRSPPVVTGCWQGPVVLGLASLSALAALTALACIRGGRVGRGGRGGRDGRDGRGTGLGLVGHRLIKVRREDSVGI